MSFTAPHIKSSLFINLFAFSHVGIFVKFISGHGHLRRCTFSVLSSIHGSLFEVNLFLSLSQSQTR